MALHYFFERVQGSLTRNPTEYGSLTLLHCAHNLLILPILKTFNDYLTAFSTADYMLCLLETQTQKLSMSHEVNYYKSFHQKISCLLSNPAQTWLCPNIKSCVLLCFYNCVVNFTPACTDFQPFPG